MIFQKTFNISTYFLAPCQEKVELPVVCSKLAKKDVFSLSRLSPEY